MRKTIVSLILVKDGKILVERRKSSDDLDAGKCVFPGGHVDDGEGIEQSLHREVREELGIELIDPILVYESDFDGPEEQQRLYWYACESFSGDLQTNEAAELLWIDPSESHLLSYQVTRDALEAYLKISSLPSFRTSQTASEKSPKP